jgi:hypothetical protein
VPYRYRIWTMVGRTGRLTRWRLVGGAIDRTAANFLAALAREEIGATVVVQYVPPPPWVAP